MNDSPVQNLRADLTNILVKGCCLHDRIDHTLFKVREESIENKVISVDS